MSGEGVQQALLKILEARPQRCTQGGRKHPHQEFLQIDTTNVLFICGGAFAASRRSSRTGSAPGRRVWGFIRRPEDKDLGAIFNDVLPEDLTNSGSFQFIGRMPVVGAVNHLEQEALVEILTEPRNALVKQYRKIFEFENVELEFRLKRSTQSPTKRSSGTPGHGSAGDSRRDLARDDVRHPGPRRSPR